MYCLCSFSVPDSSSLFLKQETPTSELSSSTRTSPAPAPNKSTKFDLHGTYYVCMHVAIRNHITVLYIIPFWEPIESFWWNHYNNKHPLDSSHLIPAHWNWEPLTPTPFLNMRPQNVSLVIIPHALWHGEWSMDINLVLNNARLRCVFHPVSRSRPLSVSPTDRFISQNNESLADPLWVFWIDCM